jgi:uncharacterized membrane protein
MSLGPFEFVVLAFPGQGLALGVRTALDRLAEAGELRVADALVVKKDSAGTTRVAELYPVPAGSGVPSLESLGLAARDDVDEVSIAIERDTTVLVMLIEHAWATDLTEAIEAAGGSVLASLRIPRPQVEEAVRTRAS